MNKHLKTGTDTAPALGSRTKRIALGVTALFTMAAIAMTAPSGAIDRKVTRKVQPASVQLGPLYTVIDKATGKKMAGSFGWGSGTILTADGFILTNAHVTDLESIKQDAADNGAEIVDGVMVVYMTKKTDEPPVPVFLANIVAQDTKLDVAVVKIASDLNGEKVDSSLSLPWVPLGDSDTVELGDTLNIFGYPAIGGKTITYTSGPVSGFETDPNFKGRAWIKTSASISGGNSGGTAVDDDGYLIGIPTRGGVEGANGVVDCRPAADTNHDNKLDENDTCVPTGGFINSLRAVNAAKAIITKATKGSTGKKSTTPTTTVPTPTTIPDVEDTEVDDTEAFDTEVPETAPPTTRAKAKTTTKGRTTTTTTPPQQADDVQIAGYVLDSATGKPLAGAWFAVLRPGAKFGEGELADEDFIATIQTDRKGFFTHPQLRLLRGESYPVAVALDGYKFTFTNGLEIPMESDDPLLLTIKLERE